jgi:hypothetical protein
MLAGLAAVAVLIRLAVQTGRADDAANDVRWAELTDTPVAVKPARDGLLPGLAAAAGRMTAFVSSGLLPQRDPRPVPVEAQVWPARER